MSGKLERRYRRVLRLLPQSAASCSHVAPVNPDPSPTVPPEHQLKSPIVLQVMRSQPQGATGKCQAGWNTGVMPPGECYRPVGAPVTITTAALTSVSAARSAPAPGQPTQYGFIVGVPSADVAAVSSLLSQAYDSRGAFGISVAGKLWEAPRVDTPLPGRQPQIALASKDQALQLYRLLVPAG